MKGIYKSTVFIVAIMFLLTPESHSQKIRAGFAGGFNMTMVDGDELYGYKKYGINAGGIVMVPISKNFTLNLETIYNEKGTSQRPRLSDSLSGEYRLQLNYLEVPFYLQYHDRGGANAGAGLSWGRLVSFGEAEHGNKLPWTKSTFPYLRDDINAFADVSFNLKKGFKFNMRYFYSLKPIRTRIFLNGKERQQYNTGFTFRLIYIIKEPEKDKSKN